MFGKILINQFMIHERVFIGKKETILSKYKTNQAVG